MEDNELFDSLHGRLISLSIFKSNQIKNFINVSEIFSLQAANWGHSKKVYKMERKCNK